MRQPVARMPAPHVPGGRNRGCDRVPALLVVIVVLLMFNYAALSITSREEQCPVVPTGPPPDVVHEVHSSGDRTSGDRGRATSQHAPFECPPCQAATCDPSVAGAVDAVTPAAGKQRMERVEYPAVADVPLLGLAAGPGPHAEVMPPLTGRGDVTRSGYTYSLRPLHLVLLVNPVPAQFGGQISEFLWIRDVLLGGLPRPVITHSATSQQPLYFNDSLVVTMWRLREDYMAEWRRRGLRNLGVYQMGDERFNPKGLRGFYDFVDAADYTFRNFPSARLLRQHAKYHWAFEGSKSGLGTPAPLTLPPPSLRPTLCIFWGSLRSEREEMLAALRAAGVSCSLQVGRWESKDLKHPIAYRVALEQAKFALTPWGNSPESMRLYEALDLAAVPVYRRPPDPDVDPLALLQPHPVPVVDSWAEAAAMMRRLEADPPALDRLQRAIVMWWARVRAEHVANVTRIVETAFAKYPD
eukprot:TRINITY_DN7028_c0_g1_i1.p2 TRINITY_DN7028_c0_g1~~TRINITY_DN7028_c0_g1_i1.p2  ORF type:complete len:468 (-),score=103.86 TRINITY_DN7028_c0_g1_i1:695-2098(-)